MNKHTQVYTEEESFNFLKTKFYVVEMRSITQCMKITVVQLFLDFLQPLIFHTINLL